MKRSAPRALVLVCGLAVAAIGCGDSGQSESSSGTDGGTRSTKQKVVGPIAPLGTVPPDAHSGPNPPPVENFDVPATVACTIGSPAKVPATYKTDKAMTVTFRVDTEQVEARPPTSGTFDIPVPCDGGSHTVELWAVGWDMSTNTRSRTVRTGA